ncbi:MAG: hypothetical protein JWM71_2138, partial [Solirubrobacteraceae bacterium]|nr:hypothetical protein [Solirubrobacteraceae bacterium]
RALRAEIAALERDLSDERLARVLRDNPRTPPRSAGGRLLSEDELREQRDGLAARLAAIHAPEPPEPPTAQRGSATRPGVVLRPVLGT